jgi:hypothetical protein
MVDGLLCIYQVLRHVQTTQVSQVWYPRIADLSQVQKIDKMPRSPQHVLQPSSGGSVNLNMADQSYI